MKRFIVGRLFVILLLLVPTACEVKDKPGLAHSGQSLGSNGKNPTPKQPQSSSVYSPPVKMTLETNQFDGMIYPVYKP